MARELLFVAIMLTTTIPVIQRAKGATWLILSSLTFIACLGASAGDDDQADPADGKADGTGTTGTIATTEPGVRVLDGYNSVFDLALSPCVTVGGGSGPAFAVGAVQESFDISLVEDRASLARQLSFDAQLGATFSLKLGSLDAGLALNLIRNYSANSTSVYVLLRARASYRVQNQRSVVLNDDARALVAAKDANRFMVRCGDRYTNGVVYGAGLFVLVRLDSQDQKTALQLKQSLKAGLKLATGTGTAMAETAFSNAISTARLSMSTVSASEGFLISGHGVPAIRLADTTDAATLKASLDNLFATVQQLRETMGMSIRMDACADGGPAVAGCGARGYADNTARNAVPVAVVTGDYMRASNAPQDYHLNRDVAGVLAPALELGAECARIQRGMESAYRDEIAPFLAASEAEKVRFNVQPPAVFQTRWQDLVATAQHWKHQFQPGGAAIKQVYTAFHDCFQSAAVGDSSRCDPAIVGSLDQPLTRYVRTGRVLPLQFQPAATTVRASLASSACAQLTDASGAPLRLPNGDEVTLLTPFVAQGTYPGSASHAVWFDYGCRGGKLVAIDGNVPFMTCDDGCTPFGCTNLGAICVPASGPQVLVPNLLAGETH